MAEEDKQDATTTNNNKLPPINQHQIDKNQNQRGNSAQSINQKNQNSKSYIDEEENVYFLQSQKKKMDDESIALKNRIRKLQQEQIILQKKASETNQKANQIYEIKKREVIKKDDQKQKQFKVDEIPFTHPVGQLNMLRCHLSRENMLKEKKLKTLQVKSQLGEIRNNKMKEYQVNEESQKVKVEILKQQKEKAKEQKQQQLDYKKQQVYQQKLLAAQSAKEEIERKKNELKFLEQQEQELLKQLTNTQDNAKDANNKLKYIIKNPPEKFEKEFGAPEKNDQQRRVTQDYFSKRAAKYNNVNSSINLQINKKGESELRKSTDNK